MHRRSLLSLFFSAPVAAAASRIAVATEATSMARNVITGDVSLMMDGTTEGSCVSEVSPHIRWARKMMDQHERREGLLNVSMRDMPPYIGERKSWSSVFKQHVYLQDKMDYQSRWDMSDDDMIKFLAKRGYHYMMGDDS